jgi:DNA-binding MarR family transcriptional regulator
MRNARSIHRLLRVLQLKNRRVRKGAELPVAIAEAHTLIELHAGSDLSVQQLVDALKIPQPQVSRVLQRLRSRGLIHQRYGKDARMVLSSLSRDGLRVVGRIDEVMGEIFDECAAHITKDEQRVLSTLLEKIAREYGATCIRVRTGESKLRAIHRQMARIFGLLGTSVYGSDLTRAEWAILEAVIQAPVPLTATIMEKYLGIKSTVISEVLTRFEVAGYIERSRSKENHRVNLLHATRLGRRYFNRLEVQASVLLQRALRGESGESLEHSREILRRFAGEWGENSIFLGMTLRTERIEAPKELKQARGFILREVVRQGWEESIPDPLVPSGSEVWGLFDATERDKGPLAVCVASLVGKAWVVSVGVSAVKTSPQQMRAFIQHAHYLSNRRGRVVPLEVKFLPTHR